MASSGATADTAATLADRAGDARRAVLLVLRAAGSQHVSNVRDGRQLLRRLQEAGQDTTPIRLLCRDLALNNGLALSKASRLAVPGLFFESLKSLLPAELTLDNFAKLPIFEEPDDVPEVEVNRRACQVSHGGRQVNVQIGTVASMKGETHLATMVLESLGWPARRFDLKEAMPVVAGLDVRNPKMTESQLAQFRNLYVGMSRPTSFLCVAVNENRISDDCKSALHAQGWVIEHLA